MGRSHVYEPVTEVPGGDRFSLREMELIALNMSLDLSRDCVCRLALSARDRKHVGPCRPIAKRMLQRAQQIARHAEPLARSEILRVHRIGARILTFHSPEYPLQLLELDLPPPVIYCLGELPARPAISIVGSRRASRAGRETSRQFARDLAQRGLTVVSGFARGIDVAAHEGALDSPRGSTIAVLGCGLDVAYPSGRRSLRELIRQRGALVSEFPLGATPRRQNFPIRNRLIAALGLGTLVIEATARSGSLITARHALDLGREVWAVPGSIFDDRSLGPNALIRDGAHLVQRPRDLLETLPDRILECLHVPEESSPPDATDSLHLALLEHLRRHHGCGIDELSRRLAKPVEEIASALLELELARRVKRSPGGAFYRRS